jgi:mannosyltransferase OCH1-like enzyme
MIPKIIHQIWEGRREPLPKFQTTLAKTWKDCHPDWQYELWDGDRMDTFVNHHYPQMSSIYFNYKYDVQRWDVIRYLILYAMGGMYVDFDYECFASFDAYLSTGKCYFALEPELHCRSFGKTIYFNNALMLIPPGHPFLEKVINHLQTATFDYTGNKYHDVLYSTGPWMLTNLYNEYEPKSDIHLFPAELVSPLSKNDVRDYIQGKADVEVLEKKLEKALAFHYFWGSWLTNNENRISYENSANRFGKL